MEYTNKWLYQGKEFESEDIADNVAFVYLITNLTNSKTYVGKKLFSTRKHKQVNKKKKRFSVESDWKTYYSSSDDLKADVVLIGPDKFKREILRLCKSKSEASYYEAHMQFEKEVLLTDSYNKWIMVRVRKANMKLK